MSLTKVTYSMINGAPINVLDYGADPTGTSNSAAAIQNAVTAAGVAGGAVYLPAGTYLLQSTISLPSNIALYGDGVISELQRDVSVTPFDMIEIKNQAHIGLYDFYINGVTKLDNGTASNRYCGIRIWADGGAKPNDIEIVGVHVDKTTSGEIQTEGNRGAILLEDCYDVRLSRCKFYDNRATAILITIKNGTTGFNTNNIQIEQCYGVGEVAPFDPDFPNGFGSFISGDNHTDVLVSGCYVDGFGFSNISMNGPRSTIQNCISKNSNYAGINLGHSTVGNNCDNSIVDGNITTNNNYSGINVAASKNIVISNNTSYNDGITSPWAALHVIHDANYDPNETTNLTIIGNQLLNSNNAGIIVEAGKYVQITSNLIANSLGNGIFFREKESTEAMWAFVSNNIFLDNGGTGNSGIEVNSSTAGGYGNTSVVVKDNYFYTSDVSAIQRWGITSAGDTKAGVQVNNNWFSSAYASGLNTGATVYGYALNKFGTSVFVNANIINV